MASAQEESGNPLNMLFLMTDQHRIDTLGCYGNTCGTSPHLDQLAADATVFDRAYTPSAICTPARASLLTGLHPFEHGLLSNYEWNSGHREELPDGLPTFSAALAERGYRLGHLGKWHVGKERGPGFYGFEGPHFAGALNPFDDPGYLAWLKEQGQPPVRITEPVFTTQPDGSTGHLIAGVCGQPTEATFEAYLADLTIDQLRRFAAGPGSTSAAPFFLACSFFGPHLPYVIPRRWYELIDPGGIDLSPSFAETFHGKPSVQEVYARYWATDSFSLDQWRRLTAIYWGYVAMIDHQIGRILNVLGELGLTDSTAVMFTADHGEFTGAHRLNDKGPAMYEDIYRIPAIVRLPGGRGRRCGAFTSLLDLTATILDLAHAPAGQVRGASLLPWVRGEQPANWRQDILCEFHGHHFPYAQRMLANRQWKYVANPEGTDELYDLRADPYELNNVIDVPAHREQLQRMRLRMYAQLIERGDKFAQWLAFAGDIPPEQRLLPSTAIERFVDTHTPTTPRS